MRYILYSAFIYCIFFLFKKLLLGDTWNNTLHFAGRWLVFQRHLVGLSLHYHLLQLRIGTHLATAPRGQQKACGRSGCCQILYNRFDQLQRSILKVIGFFDLCYTQIIHIDKGLIAQIGKATCLDKFIASQSCDIITAIINFILWCSKETAYCTIDPLDNDVLPALL